MSEHEKYCAVIRGQSPERVGWLTLIAPDHHSCIPSESQPIGNRVIRATLLTCETTPPKTALATHPQSCCAALARKHGTRLGSMEPFVGKFGEGGSLVNPERLDDFCSF
jgi:hypothetical protein